MESSGRIENFVVPLERMPSSPDDSIFWSGRMSNVCLYFCTSGQPTEHQLQFARGVLLDLDTKLRQARRYLALAVKLSPEKFGIDRATAEQIYQSPDEALPFDLPECVFYEDGKWQIRFAAGRHLPAFDTLGVAVEFDGHAAVSALDLSQAVPDE
jgi:hypothetical protein